MHSQSRQAAGRKNTYSLETHHPSAAEGLSSLCRCRCHPQLSAIPNARFYGGKLLDGCTAAQLPPLAPDVPTLGFQDVRGQEARSGQSVSNAAEAAAVQRSLQHLASAGIPPERMGVICFFRAQARRCSVCAACEWCGRRSMC